MLLRLVRPMKRKGSSNAQCTKRIPPDLMARMIGMKLAVPIGEDIASITITPRMQTIRFPLKTSDPSTARVYHAEAAAYRISVASILLR